jgi:prepilin-type N-terminal cleavage/methylation domain-containing protein
MRPRAARGQRDSGAGFTLVELLLAVALVALLLSAVVFNFAGLQRGASLDEGASQFESLLRFARAHAASSGRQVEIMFEEDVGEGLFVPLGNLRVLWEPDPVQRPGIFEPLPELQEYVSRLTDLISIEEVRLVEGDSFDPAPAAALDAPTEPAVTAEAADLAEPGTMLVTFPPITFQPDGSSDSAEIILASRTEDDTRRIAVRLQGITGAIRRRLVTDESKAGMPVPEPSPPGVATIPGATPAP